MRLKVFTCSMLTEANYFADIISKNMVVSMVCTIGLTVIFYVLSVFKLERLNLYDLLVFRI